MGIRRRLRNPTLSFLFLCLRAQPVPPAAQLQSILFLDKTSATHFVWHWNKRGEDSAGFFVDSPCFSLLFFAHEQQTTDDQRRGTAAWLANPSFRKPSCVTSLRLVLLTEGGRRWWERHATVATHDAPPCLAALESCGCKVYHIGLVPTPTVGLMVRELGASGGIATPPVTTRRSGTHINSSTNKDRSFRKNKICGFWRLPSRGISVGSTTVSLAGSNRLRQRSSAMVAHAWSRR